MSSTEEPKVTEDSPPQEAAAAEEGKTAEPEQQETAAEPAAKTEPEAQPEPEEAKKEEEEVVEDDEEEPDDGVPRVLVTGASGYIASHLVKALLEDGRFRVRGTVRSLKNQKKVTSTNLLAFLGSSLCLLSCRFSLCVIYSQMLSTLFVWFKLIFATPRVGRKRLRPARLCSILPLPSHLPAPGSRMTTSSL